MAQPAARDHHRRRAARRRHAARVVARVHPQQSPHDHRSRRRDAAGAAADGARLLPADSARPGRLVGGAWLSVTDTHADVLVHGFGRSPPCIYSFPFAVQPLQAAFEASAARRSKRRRRWRASPLDRFWHVASPLALRGYVIGGRADLRAHARRVRRRADGRRQHSRQHQSHLDRDLRARRDASTTRRRTCSRPGCSCSRSSCCSPCTRSIGACRSCASSVHAHEHAVAERRASIARASRCDVDQPLALAGITALFGPSGSGKTTLLRVIAGLEREARGTVTLRRRELGRAIARDVPTHRRRIGYVFQDGRLFPHLTVEQNLRFGLQRSATGARTADRLRRAAVEALDLGALLPRRTPSLSGGEQQRVAIARALLTSPRLMLMDEPLSSLDVARKREILPHIEKLPATFGIPVLYVTHNVDEVARLADRRRCCLTVGESWPTTPSRRSSSAAILGAFTGGLEAGVVLRAQVAAIHNGIATLRVGKQQLRVPMAAADVGRLARSAFMRATWRSRPYVREKLSIRNVLTSAHPHDRDRGEPQRRAAARRRRRALTCENYRRRPRRARALRRPAKFSR